jgi:uncharacterized repeat protein (TIGR03803 family)
MTNISRHFSHLFPGMPRVMLALATCLLPLLTAIPAQAQNYSVIHAFTGAGDGDGPKATLTLNGGILYGTTTYGGGVNGRNCDPHHVGCGTVFQMKQHNNAWIFTPLYQFTGFGDGQRPVAPVVFGPGGLLYGSAIWGGNVGTQDCNFGGCGVVFTMHPTATACHAALCNWIQNPIYQFASLPDGFEPTGNMAFDPVGNLYGITTYGGNLNCESEETGCGTVFELVRSGSGWSKSTLYLFHGVDGEFPTGGIVRDSAGVLYGTTADGGANDFGTVFALTPSGSGYTRTTIHDFQNTDDGEDPQGGLVMDAAGNLYGTTQAGGNGHGGTVFELSPSGGSWTFTVLASLLNPNLGGGPLGALAFDAAGNLYGTSAFNGANGCGYVFKLTHSGGQWTFSDLHDFTCDAAGGKPEAGPTLDANGNIFGVADYGPPCTISQQGCGIIWEITP